MSCVRLRGILVDMRPMQENIKVLYFANKCLEPNVEIITGKDAVKRRRSVCSSEEGNRSEDEEPEDLLPVLRNHSQLLNDHHIESLANHMPARTQGYPWNLVYSTAIHGTSLKTLYRQMAHIDSPVLLVIKDMEKKVFGAFSSHPFRVSDCCYGTGETFVYSFDPAFKVTLHAVVCTALSKMASYSLYSPLLRLTRAYLCTIGNRVSF
uniref:Nuclear receptor coactivator 7a n=1 Tax=Oncorhynchus kisutch TaxID=8019 RepID=A0A8C7DIN3_ONCKI